jgi:NAD(P)H-hydrate epimerase
VIRSSLGLNVITAKDIAPLLGPRPRDSNKGMYGHVLVVGGSFGKAGAAAMAGFSALRSGAGLVTVATPGSVLPMVAGFHPELMTEALEETGDGTVSVFALDLLRELAKKKTVLAIGPGVSRNHETSEVVRKLVAESENAIVLDADGLNAFEGRARDLSRKSRRMPSNDSQRTLVLTPHPGEMSRLTGLTIAEIQRNRMKVARDFATDHDVILVLKGDRTIVAAPDQVWVNTSGNPGMATGGTGDILTGMIAGMLAQYPQSPLQAVLAAVNMHGRAGDLAVRCWDPESLSTQPLVATDLLRTLPQVFPLLRNEAKQMRTLLAGTYMTSASR